MPLDLSALVIALIAAIFHYAHLAVPYVHTGFTLLLIGFLVLVGTGCRQCRDVGSAGIDFGLAQTFFNDHLVGHPGSLAVLLGQALLLPATTREPGVINKRHVLGNY